MTTICLTVNFHSNFKYASKFTDSLQHIKNDKKKTIYKIDNM